MPPAARSRPSNPLLRKVGPAPVWLWAVAGLVGLYVVYRLRGASSGGKAAANQFPAPSSVGYTPAGDAGGGAGISGIPPGPTGDLLGPPYAGDLGSSIVSVSDASSVDASLGPDNTYVSPGYTGPDGGLVIPVTYQALGYQPEPIDSGMVAPPDLSYLSPVTPPAWTPELLPPSSPGTWSPSNITPWSGTSTVPPPTPSTTGASPSTYGGVLNPEWSG